MKGAASLGCGFAPPPQIEDKTLASPAEVPAEDQAMWAKLPVSRIAQALG